MQELHEELRSSEADLKSCGLIGRILCRNKVGEKHEMWTRELDEKAHIPINSSCRAENVLFPGNPISPPWRNMNFFEM